MLVLLLQRVSSGVSGFASSMGEAARLSKLEEFSHKMFVFKLQHVSVRVSAFSLALPCLWGKLKKHVLFEGVEISKLEDVSHGMIFFETSTMSYLVSLVFLVADLAVCCVAHSPCTDASVQSACPAMPRESHAGGRPSGYLDQPQQHGRALRSPGAPGGRRTSLP